MVFQNNVLSGAGGSGTTVYEIDQSIRFNEADSPYMQKTYSGDGSRTTWSFSFWTKLGKSPPYNSTRGNFLIAYNTTSGAQEDIRIEGSNQQLQWFTHNDGGTGTLADLKTTQYLRDHSAWYHILCVADRTNVVSSERQRMYINGQRVTDFATETYPSQSAEGHVGKSADVHYLGSRGGNSNTRLDGYMAEIHYLDGLAYDPSYFGETTSEGIWIPKEYTGSYGTNGFKIDGRDSSDLGDDESGQGNDYTTSGLAAHDQVSDSPTNNFATFNPVMTNDSDFEFSEGNLKLDMNTNKSWYVGAGASMSMTSGKWYWESYWNSGDSYTIWGILDTEQLHALAGSGSTSIYALNFNGIQPNSSGTNDQYRQGQGGSAIATGQAGAPGGIWQFALDMDNKKMWLGYNGTYVGSGDPAGGTNETWSSTYIASDSYTPINQGYQISAHSILTYNFGQDSTFAGATSAGGNSDASGIGNFKYSVPSGFKALCTKNLGS